MRPHFLELHVLRSLYHHLFRQKKLSNLIVASLVISQPSKEVKNPWNPNLKTGSSWSGSKTGWGGAGNPSIPTSNLSTSGSGWKPEDSNPPPITTETLDKMKRDYEKKRNEFDSNVKESDSNLKEQRKSLMTDKENRVDEVIEKKLIHDCSKEGT